MKLWHVCAALLIIPPSPAAPLKRRDASEVPTAAISGGSCRLRLNEINIFPSGAQQFVELIRICNKDPQKVFDVSMEDGKKRSVYKLVFITHDGNLIGVCELRGKTVSRHGFHVFYTVGGEHYVHGKTRDMKIEECSFADDYEYPSAANRFPAGDYAPVGLGLVYNPSSTVLNPISLDRLGTRSGYKKVRIDNALKKKIVENLQDFVVYSSSSPYTRCKHFSEYYSKYSPSSDGLYIIRDWAQLDDNMDYSRSRCSLPTESQTDIWLPFSPKSYNYAPASPNSPNICEKSIRFVIEEEQTNRAVQLEHFGEDSACYISTEDEAITSLHTITNPLSYGMRLKSLVQARALEVTKAVEAVLPASSSCNDENPFTSVPSGNLDAVEPFTVSPIPMNTFEQQLKQSSPHIWATCENFQPQSLLDYLRSAKNPDIYPNDILNPKTCSWFEYLIPSRKFRCKFCNRLLAQGIIPETKGSKLLTLMMTSGQGYSGQVSAKTWNSKLINDHHNNVIHEIAEDFFMLCDSGKEGEDLMNAFHRPDGPFRRHIKATENAFCNVFQCIRLDIPFEKYEIQAETMNYFEVNIGFLYLNPSGHKLILMSISQTMHEDFVARLLQTQPVLSVMLDTSTDISSMSTLAIVFHVFGQNGDVQVALYRIIKVTKGETAQALFDLFKNALQEDGLQDYVKSRCIGFSSDGGPNVVKFRKLFNEFTDHNLAAVHCMNHRLELTIKKAWKEISELKQVEELVNVVYSLFHRSAKKKIALAEAAEEAGVKEFEVKRIITTRWMATRARAIKSIFDHWKPIVSALSEIQKDRSYEVKQRVKASVAYQMLLDPYMLSTLAFMADVCEVIAATSLNLQHRATSVIGKREKREILQDTLVRMETENGPRLEQLLKTAKLSGAGSGGTEMSLVQFEDGPVAFESFDLISTGVVYFAKLSSKRTQYLQPIVEQIDAYYPEDVTDHFDVLDPNRWTKLNLNDFGDDDLKQLNTGLLWNHESHSLLTGWKNLKASVYYHKDFQDKKKETPEDFWQFYLLEPSVVWSDDMKAIVKTILTVQSSSAEVERIYSMYTHTKTPQRYSLAVSTVEAIVRVKFNGPKRLVDFNAKHFAIRFLHDHSRADDESRRRCPRNEAKPSGAEDAPQSKQPRLEEQISMDVVDDTNADDTDGIGIELMDVDTSVNEQDSLF